MVEKNKPNQMISISARPMGENQKETGKLGSLRLRTAFIPSAVNGGDHCSSLEMRFTRLHLRGRDIHGDSRRVLGPVGRWVSP